MGILDAIQERVERVTSEMVSLRDELADVSEGSESRELRSVLNVAKDKLRRAAFALVNVRGVVVEALIADDRSGDRERQAAEECEEDRLLALGCEDCGRDIDTAGEVCRDCETQRAVETADHMADSARDGD